MDKNPPVLTFEAVMTDLARDRIREPVTSEL